MKYIYSIVDLLAPSELVGQSYDVFMGFGCVLIIALFVFIFYKIVRIFF